MQPTPKEILGSISGGRVLDIATGRGNFIHFLIEGLQDYREIIGVDNNERYASEFTQAFNGQANIHFMLKDAAQLDFEDGSFDLVCISNSLHHLSEPLPVLLQMTRVLRPCGFLLVSEMYRDGQTDTQMTHVLLHDWWGAVDTLGGIVHHETYRRSEIVEMVFRMGLCEKAIYDLSDLESDPRDPEIMAELEPVFERYIQLASGYSGLQARGEQLHARVQQVGFHSATTLLMIMRKA